MTRGINSSGHKVTLYGSTKELPGSRKSPRLAVRSRRTVLTGTIGDHTQRSCASKASSLSWV